MPGRSVGTSDRGGVGMLANQEHQPPCLLPVPSLACEHSCWAGSFPRHQDPGSLLRSVSSCLPVVGVRVR